MLAVITVGILSLPSADAATAADVHDPVEIGTFGGPWSDAAAVNDAGQVVGSAGLPGIPRDWGVESGPTHAFSWTAAGGIVDLGTLGGDFSFATAVNASGQVVGQARAAGEEPMHSFSWTAAGGMVDLDGSADRSSSPTAIADSGQVIGTSQAFPECGYRCGSTPPKLEAYSWTPGGGSIDIGSLGGDHTSAVGVNNSGQVVGSSSLAVNGPNHAYVWTATGGIVDLGTLGGSSSHATDVSDSGQIVGISTIAGDSTSHAFSWTAAGGMVDLGSLGSNSYAHTVTENGQVIGVTFTAETSYRRVFSWTAAGGMVDIGTLGDPSNEVDIIAVGESGQVIGESFDRAAWNVSYYSWTSGGGMVDFGPDSRPYAVNASAAVVGSSYTADGFQNAFFWTAKRGMVALGSLDGTDGSYAKAINNSNLVMGSSGYRAVVWQLPTDKKVDKKVDKKTAHKNSLSRSGRRQR